MIEWMDEKLKEVSKMLTRNHTGLVRQLIAFKSRTNKRVKDIEQYQNRMKEAEQTSAQISTILETEYGLETKSPLQLYDCLVP